MGQGFSPVVCGSVLCMVEVSEYGRVEREGVSECIVGLSYSEVVSEGEKLHLMLSLFIDVI